MAIKQVEKIAVIASLPPRVEHRSLIINHPLINELRFNTCIPVYEKPKEVLSRLKKECGDKKLWIDIKSRQLRLTEFAYLPYAYVTLNHSIRVDIPCTIVFKDCIAKIIDVIDGKKLILEDRPLRVVGAGEAVSILDPSLVIDGLFTESDLAYLEAARALGLTCFMLSFVEKQSDIESLKSFCDVTEVVAKIESRRGIGFVKNEFRSCENTVRLMAARDDLLINLNENPWEILVAMRTIIKSDPNAILASKIFASLETENIISMGDISDLGLAWNLGYRTLMLSDKFGYKKDAFVRAMQEFERFKTLIAGSYSHAL